MTRWRCVAIWGPSPAGQGAMAQWVIKGDKSECVDCNERRKRLGID